MPRISDSNAIIKTEATGDVATFSEEYFDHDYMLFVKDYRLNDFPKNERGEYAVDMPWEQYAEWLEAYLYGVEIELRPDQEKLRQHYINKPPSGIMIGTHCGMFEAIIAMHPPAYEFPENFEFNPDSIRKIEEALDYDPYTVYLGYMDGQDILSREQFILQQHKLFLKRQAELIEFEQYWPSFYKIDGFTIMAGGGDISEMPDFGWRVHLSLALKTIPERSQRIQFINEFMDEFCDYLRK